MQHKYLLIFLLLLPVHITGQLQFSAPIILTSSYDPRVPTSVGISDVDGDGFCDIVATNYAASQDNPLLFWLQNTGDQATFIRKDINTDAINGPDFTMGTCLCIADLDGDADQDIILGAFIGENSISWFENMDGSGNFSAPKTVKPTGGHHLWPYAADFNNDADIDIIDADWDGLEFYENTDGNGSFELKTISGSTAASLLAMDIEADNDLDIIASLQTGIVWYQNTDGMASFGPPQSISNQGTGFLHLADLDNDADLDLLAGSQNKLAWYKNTNGAGTFGPQLTITQSLDNVYAVCTADLDNDGDLDILTGSHGDSLLAWYENTNGEGHFSTGRVINHPYGRIASVHCHDFDRDGDKDILVATEGHIFWLENLTAPSFVRNDGAKTSCEFALEQNYPNPFNPVTKIRFELPETSQVSLVVLNVMGREAKTLIKAQLGPGYHLSTWNGDDNQGLSVTAGVYYLALNTEKGRIVKKMVLIR